VVIDTPGFALGDMRTALDLVRAVAACDDLDIHLVLSAIAKPEDALRAAEAYSIFRPNKLIFTHLDETIHARTMIEVAGQLDLPVSFLCAGTGIPEDIEPATRRRITALAEAVAPRATHRKGAGA
jgi:flagellar biosynthesis protein FlhF